MSQYNLFTPKKISQNLAQKIKAFRIQRNWTQETLAKRSGVSLGSLRRFEQTGQISLDSLLLLVSALGRLQDFADILNPPKVRSIRELEARMEPKRKRGRI